MRDTCRNFFSEGFLGRKPVTGLIEDVVLRAVARGDAARGFDGHDAVPVTGEHRAGHVEGWIGVEPGTGPERRSFRQHPTALRKQRPGDLPRRRVRVQAPGRGKVQSTALPTRPE
jgi:hypothetical protein